MFTTWLLEGGDPSLRAATLGLVRDLLRGPLPGDAFRDRTGMDLAQAEMRWRRTLTR